MKSSIATVCLSGGLIEKLDAISAAGYTGAEIFENDLLCAPQTAREIGNEMRDRNLACTMFQPFRDYEGLPRELRQAALERMKRKFETMDDLGTDLILLCSNCSPQASGDRNQILDDLALLGDFAAKHQKRIGYEALAWAPHIHDHREAWSLVRDVDHPAIGLVLDSFHSLAREIPNASIGDIRPEKLFIVQLADAPKLDMDALNWSRHFRCMPGQGDLPVTEFASYLHRIGYEGFWSLEIFNDQFRAGSPNQVARDGIKSLRSLEDRAKRELGKSGTLPPPISTIGIEFLEFAASHEEAGQLQDIFLALGFSPIARHRNKDVTHWRQGDVNLVVNSEPEGLAHSFDIVHGASVCAIGLLVDNQRSALSRAEALDITRYEQAAAPDEWSIPSIRSVGGSLIYLVEAASRHAMWKYEFPVDDGLQEKPDLIVSVDHIAQTMAMTEFQSWLLYYLCLFDVAKTQQVEIPDQKGLVYSQAIESPDRKLRVTLNGSLAQQSLSSRFVQNNFGSGVQHIAFRTEDIFATAERAAAAGMEFLPIGPNYYTDLIARFGLDAEFAEKLHKLNILYDRSNTGEYFQFYSRAVGKRLFFEVVERREYDAYGAANAQIRLNAQARFREIETA